MQGNLAFLPDLDVLESFKLLLHYSDQLKIRMVHVE